MREVVVLEGMEAITRDAALRFVALSHLAGERFTVALAGGSTPKALYEQLSTEPYKSAVDWSRVFLFFGDERCVPPVHENSNYAMAKTALLDLVPVPPENVFRMKGEIEPEKTANDYEESLNKFFGVEKGEFPRFDLIMLGMGSDGHTASLFPGKASLEETERSVIASAPGLEPFVPRLTLTFPVLNNAKDVIFLISGQDKSVSLEAILDLEEGESRFPASLVNLTNGSNIWLVDHDAMGI